MVRPWDEWIAKGISLTKYRLAHHLKHGCGNNVIVDKARLAKQERHKENRKDKL